MHERDKKIIALRNNILEILDNVGTIFTADTYSHYKELSKETEFARSIAERSKLRKEKIVQIET